MHKRNELNHFSIHSLCAQANAIVSFSLQFYVFFVGKFVVKFSTIYIKHNQNIDIPLYRILKLYKITIFYEHFKTKMQKKI